MIMLNHMKIKITVTFILIFSVAKISSGQNERRDEMLQKLEARRAAFITTRLNLSSDESTKFWPVYNEYSRKRMDLRKARRQYLQKEGKNEKFDAQQEIDNQLAVEEQEVEIKKSYYNRFQSLIGAEKLSKLDAAEREFNQEVLKKLRERRSNK